MLGFMGSIKQAFGLQEALPFEGEDKAIKEKFSQTASLSVMTKVRYDSRITS